MQAIQRLQITKSLSNRVIFFGLLAFTILLGYWAITLIKPYPTGQSPWIFLDYLNLAIHEAGHLLFSPFGLFAQILGGSVMQVLVPSLFFGYFIRTKEVLGCGFCLFWIGNNLVNVSYYVNDAVHRRLPLLGGDSVIHDWQWLLVELNWLDSAEIIALIIKVVGVGLIFAALAILLLILLQESKAQKI